MSTQCGNSNPDLSPTDPCQPVGVCCGSSCSGEKSPLGPAGAHFQNSIAHALAAAEQAHQDGRPIVGILCEYTPRELIMAAGALSVCLCGGSAEMIDPAERELPANLCPLIKSTYGYHLTKTNPFLEMADLIVAETTCDGKKKMYELMAQSRPMHVLELPQKPDQAQAFGHWLHELRELRQGLEGYFGTSISDEKLREAIRLMNRERTLRRKLAELMKADSPPLTGRQLLDFKSTISGLEGDFTQYETALEDLTHQAGPPERAQQVRVLLTGVPMAHGAERVMDLIEEAGGLVVALESCTGVKPIWDNIDETAADPLEAIARKYFQLPCSVMTPNDGRLDLLAELAQDFRAECVIDLTWQACLTYDVEAARVRKFADETLHLPYLQIVTDYSPNDSARISVRVEALLETVIAKRPANKPNRGCQ